MKDTDILIKDLYDSPDILENLIREIPEKILKERRIAGKWSIHEHACHLAEVQPMLSDRLTRFKKENHPEFKPYLPGTNVPDDNLIKLNLQDSLKKFRIERENMIRLLQEFEENDWGNKGSTLNIHNIHLTFL